MAGAGGHVDDSMVRHGAGVVVGPGMSRRRPSDCPLPVQKWLKRDAVDLAVELDGYDGSVPVKAPPMKETEVEAAKRLTREEVLKIYGVDLPPVTFPAVYTLNGIGMRISTSHRVPLSQLQAQGFNTTPPPGHPIDMALKSIGKALDKIIDEPDVGGPGTPKPSPPT